MKNIGNVVYVAPEGMKAVYVVDKDIVSEKEALTPTGRVKRKYTRLTLCPMLKRYLYVQKIFAEADERKYYCDNNGWCQTADIGTYVNLAEPTCYGVLTEIYDYRGRRRTDGQTKVYF